MFLYLKKTETI